MKKLATADCIDAIKEKFGQEGRTEGTTARWKRQSKSGNKEDGFVRLFVATELPDIQVIVRSTEYKVTQIEIIEEMPNGALAMVKELCSLIRSKAPDPRIIDEIEERLKRQAKALSDISPEFARFFCSLEELAKIYGAKISFSLKLIVPEEEKAKEPRHFSAHIDQEELARKILDAAKNNSSNSYKDQIGEVTESATVKVVELDFMVPYTYLTDQISHDLSKVNFDCENIMDPEFETLENGLSLLWVTAGGDWETPIKFVIYWDGEMLRGYIPTDGNIWNIKTGSAYGNYDNDPIDFRERFPKSGEYDTPFDHEKMVQEITSTIKPVNK